MMLTSPAPSSVPAQPADFSGRWATSFGPMTLRQDGARVTGTYGREGAENSIDRTAAGGKLTFKYKEAVEQGSGWFRLRRPGSFAGEYLADGRPRSLPWQGWRGLDGLWDTSIGRLHLLDDGARVRGSVEYDASARLEAE